MFKIIVINALVAALILGGGQYAYHKRVVEPGQRFGVIDVAEIWRIKEAQFSDATRGGAADPQRAKAMEIAQQFAQRLPAALDELAHECGCVVLARSAIVAHNGNAVDLTPALLSKVAP